MGVIPAGAFGEHVAQRLRDSYVIWLSTVANDGTPQPNPVWFVWDGEESIVVYNRPDARRLTHVDARPNVSLHLDGNGRGGDVVVLAGTARRATDLPPPHEMQEYLAKYGSGMERVSGSAEQFSAEYSIPLRITVRRIRGF